MKPHLPLLSALLLTVAIVPPLPAGATEVHKLGKVICSPERMTRCDEQGKCEAREATDRDRRQLLILDFAGKKAIERREDAEKADAREREIGVITEDAIAGNVRTVVVRRAKADADAPPVISATLDGAGKLLGESRRGRQRFEAICKARAG
jgi:hypothetical protein